MKIGFIGFGSMGRAIAEGLLARNVCTPEDIYACAGHFDKLQETADKLGVHAERTAADVVAKSDWVVPAVVPAILEDVLGPVLPALRDKIVVSIVSGWDFARYEAFLAPGTHHISTIPNTPIAIGEGVLACESTHNLTEAEYAQKAEGDIRQDRPDRPGHGGAVWPGGHARRLHAGVHRDVSRGPR